MAESQPLMKCHHRPGYRYSHPGCPGIKGRCKIRLELRSGLQGCTPLFFVSSSWIFCGCPQNVDSDKMQTKTAQKETQDSHPRSLKSLYNGGVSTSIAKVVIISGKSNLPGILQVSHVLLHQVINQSAWTDSPLLAESLDGIPGLPVNGDDHLHPLVLGICRFPPTPRSCTSPCFLCHIQSSLSFQYPYTFRNSNMSFILGSKMSLTWLLTTAV